MTEARYYDPETGGSTTEARDLCQYNVVHDSFAARELARLQRERDEARGAHDAVLAALNAVRDASECDSDGPSGADLVDVVRNLVNDSYTLATERAAREKAEAAVTTLRAELRMARRQIRVMDLGIFACRWGDGWEPRMCSDDPDDDVAEAWEVAEHFDVLWHGGKPFETSAEAYAAAWTALHDAGLVEDEDV